MEYYTSLTLGVYLGATFGSLFYLSKVRTKLGLKDKFIYGIIAMYLGVSPFSQNIETIVDFIMKDFGDYKGISPDFSAFLTSALAVSILDAIYTRWTRFIILTDRKRHK